MGGAHFLLVTFLGLEAVVVVWGGWRGAVQSNVEGIVLYCWSVRSAPPLPPPASLYVSQSVAAPPFPLLSPLPAFTSNRTSRSGNRRSPNPAVTLQPVGSGLSIVAPRSAASFSCFPCFFVLPDKSFCLLVHLAPFFVCVCVGAAVVFGGGGGRTRKQTVVGIQWM